jgi:hypothetical protein
MMQQKNYAFHKVLRFYSEPQGKDDAAGELYAKASVH